LKESSRADGKFSLREMEKFFFPLSIPVSK
jgi:hypothetical protein